MKNKLLVLTLTLVVSPSIFANRYWPSQPLTNWKLYLNNGVAYISSTQMADHCTHDRAQINMSGTEYDKALYAYALAAKTKGKSLIYVVDSTQTICVISGLSEVN